MTEKYNVNSLMGLENDELQSELLIHPIANLFPEMSELQFDELKQDIAQNGLQMPILMYGGKVVDGRHRLRACSALGVTPKFAELEAANDKSAEQSVISINLHRRHLTEGQKAIIAARLTNSFVGANQHTAGAVSQRKVAEELGISVDSVQRGKKVLNNGTPELIAAVSEGKLDISNAAKLAQLAKQDQSQLNFDDIKTIQEASKAINKAKFESRRQERIQEIEAKRANNKPLESSLGTFSVILADPPWDYMGELAVGYPCMSVKEICEMPISQISADDAVLFMWCSSSLLPEAVEVVKAWGFTFKTSAVWDKDFSGQGTYFRQGHEVLMIATKGLVPEVPYDARPSSVLKFKRREHSRKPDEVYQIIDHMYPELSKVELFCRGEPANGWAGWGNECTQKNTDINASINVAKQA
ncbi:MT-A70 family methyltransferase [Methylotenera mobilis]|uniref:MT-A70 family protein n=1 Tax=Methylotenera mobilis (strain JLW8 / ATCC BAA-1282 / DSM 17540) TaxID=583345 RepID=C6WSQ3_METML|nr:MT-A70 family methyltransferase [Methylotenera mobilis]ACT47145.1 MT-A70 family protein [Methylotenera mobilis JLW8]